jgi:hypothetical protein
MERYIWKPSGKFGKNSLATFCLSGCFSKPQRIVARPTFPKTLREFQSQFATEEACQKYLAACRWPDDFVCPRCGNRSAYDLVTLRRWQCAGCRHQISVTAQTILHNTKMPLTVWFWAA